MLHYFQQSLFAPSTPRRQLIKQTRFSLLLSSILVVSSGLSYAHNLPQYKANGSHSNLALAASINELKKASLNLNTSNDVVIDSEYRFEGKLDDSAGHYQLTLNGSSETYIDDNNSKVLSLVGESYLALPEQMSQDFQLDESVYISVDFMIPDTGIDESARVIFSNKNWAYDAHGLKLTAFNEKSEWMAEGKFLVDFNIGLGVTEIASRFYELDMGTWYTATVNLDVKNNTVGFGVGGRFEYHSLSENIDGNSIDPSDFIQHMGQTELRFGAHYSEPGQPVAWHYEHEIENGVNTTANVADVRFDNLIVRSPIPAGDSAVIKSALMAFTQHLSGEANLTDEALNNWLVSLRENLNEANIDDFASEAIAFINAHADENGALYKIEHKNNVDNVKYDDFDEVSKAYVDLVVWLLDEGLTSATASSIEGLTLIEHAEFPGEVTANAARVQEGKADVKASFVPDPGYLLGGMKAEPDSELSAYLYRPTGFYAPAGEKVTIKVADSWVNSGLHIRVGAHNDNHMTLVETSRFPKLSVDYRIESNTVEVINPLGGGIYILVPQNIDLGWSEISITGAVRSPYFSTRTGFETAEQDWQAIKQYPGPFADFESDKFMITVPTYGIQNFDQPRELLERWDEIMDIFQLLHGRPLERSRAEAYLLDATQFVIGSFPGGYPVTPGFYAEVDNDITKGYYTPFAALNNKSWEQDRGMLVMLHELGHHHNGRFILEGEQEVFVNVFGAAVLNKLYGLSFDDALNYSGYQEFTRTDAAIDWMVTHNFRNGNPIGYDPTTDINPIETSYQARGHAKYLDLADISGSWDAIGKIYQKYYEEDLASGNPPQTQVGVTHDDFLKKGSDALQCNLASLFHFWGIHPSEAVATDISQYPACDGALERVITYLDNAPRTNEELVAFYDEKMAVDQGQLKTQVYDTLLAEFDVSHGQQIRNIGAEVLKAYFNVEIDQAPSIPEVSVTDVTLESDSTSDVVFSWKEAVDPEGKPLDYTWVMKRSENDEVLITKTHVSGNSVAISAGEIKQLVESMGSDSSIQLVQQVTTSDTFTVVQSEATQTTITVNNSSNDAGSDGNNTNLGNSDSNDSSGGGGGSASLLLLILMGRLFLLKLCKNHY